MYGFFKNGLNRWIWDLNARVILFPKVILPIHIINLLTRHNVGINSRLPFHKNSAKKLHKINLQNITNYCCRHQITVPENINRLKVTPNILFSKFLLHNKHPYQIILSFMKSKNLTFVPADKTPHLCILHEQILSTMVNLHLSDTNTYTIIPTSRKEAIDRVLKKAMNSIPQITGKHFTIPSNTTNRTFKILVKLQKPPSEWISYPYIPKSRPIVNDINSITNAACKTILPYLQKIKSQLTYTCSSSLQIIYKLNNLNNDTCLSTYTLATADLENMYTNIDTDILLHILESPTYPLPNKNQFLNLLRHILKYTTFSAQNNFYLQKRGLPMGSCLSSTLANIFLDSYENEIIPRHDNKHPSLPLLYSRYIDDILILAHEKNTPQAIFNELSERTGLKINFQTSNKCITFLDIYLTKNTSGSIITSTHYKFASPVLRPFIKSVQKETKVIVSQLLRIWRTNNHNSTLSAQIQQITKYLITQRIKKHTLQTINKFLAPVNLHLNNSTNRAPLYSCIHNLCPQCQEINQRFSIQIPKIHCIDNNIIASRMPTACSTTVNTIICKTKLLHQWFLSQEENIHNTIELYHNNIATILPIGNLSTNQIQKIHRKFPNITIPQTRLIADEDDPLPVYIYPVVQKPTALYGLPTANRREKLLKNHILRK
jgi:hypothetical protein